MCRAKTAFWLLESTISGPLSDVDHLHILRVLQSQISSKQLFDVGEEERLLMPSVEYGRFGLQPAAINRRKLIQGEPKKRKSRQEICALLKWLCFLANFLVFLVGVTCLALGVYLCVKDPRAVSEWADVLLNPAVMLTLIGLAVCVVSLMGSLGALRDNICLLKTFALSVFFCYIVIVVFTFLLFILFYSDTTEGLSANSILLYSIKKYHTNRNIADFVDYMQEQLECCGASSAAQGYRDWQLSEQFNCSSSNPYPEKCGVPFSCCRRSVISEAAGSSNPLLPAMRSLECWKNAQSKRPQDLEADLHTRGCLQPLRSLFESHAVHVGAVVAAIIVPVCISVCLSNILAKQIDHQHYLLEREARRCERRRRRDRQRFRDPFTACDALERGATVPTHVSSMEKKKAASEVGAESASKVETRTSLGSSVGSVNAAVQQTLPFDAEKRKQRRHRKTASSSPRRRIPLPASAAPQLVHEDSKTEKRRQKRYLRPSSSSPRRRLPHLSSVYHPQRGHSVEAALAPFRRGKEKRRRSANSLTTAESRTQQWVLQQSDLVAHEPIA